MREILAFVFVIQVFVACSVAYSTSGVSNAANGEGNVLMSAGTVSNIDTCDSFRMPSPSAPSSDFTLSRLAKNNIMSLPSGQYSGITKVSDSRYAVVHDKYKGGGIVFFNLNFGKTGSIISSSYEIPVGTSESTLIRDPEGIVYVPSTNTLFVAGEADQQILEYDMDGRLTGRGLSIPPDMQKDQVSGNYGFEALGYSQVTGLFWTTTENCLPIDKYIIVNSGHVIRLQSFSDKNLEPDRRYLYMLDAPEHTPVSGEIYAYGVPDILALDDGKLIVMEREAVVPESKVGATTKIKFYLVDPVNDAGDILSKRLVYTIDTMFTLLGWNWANYEGLCLGPDLGGKHTILLVNDSQDRYSNVLQDFLTVLKF